MKRAGLFACLAIAAGTLLSAATGCELIASVDRSKIAEGGGGAGGATGGGGTMTTGGTGGTGGTVPTCTDPVTDCTDALSGECKMWTCDAGACVEANVPDGTEAATQTDGDCKKNVCMGGVSTAENDDADTLDDMNDCTADTCDAGSPTSTPEMAGATCMSDNGKVCDGAGACVECLSNADCTDTTKPVCSAGNICIPATCTDGLLNGSETDLDCGGGDCDPCDTDKTCAVDGDCYHGKCDGGTMKCAAPTCSDGVQNGGDYLMDNGETDVDCGGPCGATCKATQGCNDNGDCVGDQCTGMGGTCVPNCADQEKNNAETDVDCGGGTCGGCAVGQDCGSMDANCVSTAYCDMMGQCAAKLPTGDACMGNNQCASAFCVDMVCCNVACGGTCQACNNAGSVGTCSPVAAGQDPANECNGNGGDDVCDGSGACAKANGTTCAAGGECASGSCVDGVCCNTACTGACQACSMAKTGGADGTCGNVTANTDPDNECTASLDCNGSGACESPLADGSACTVDAECANNHCVDGVCCNTACTGACSACSAAKKGSGSDGTCGFIGAGADPDDECAGALSCDGGGACEQLSANGTACSAGGECSSGNCVDSVCCDTTCTGACMACNVSGSAGTCSADPGLDGMPDTCMSGQTCNAGTCQ